MPPRAEFGQVMSTGGECVFVLYHPAYGVKHLYGPDLADAMRQIKERTLVGSDWTLFECLDPPARARLAAICTRGHILILNHDLMDQVTT